jgi:quinol monooxygenase YgiN
MSFIQTINFATDDRDKIVEVMGRWSADAVGNGTAQRGVLSEDRADPGRMVLAVWFESAEAAAANSERPETSGFAEEFGALCSDGPEFREFDVVEVYGE